MMSGVAASTRAPGPVSPMRCGTTAYNDGACTPTAVPMTPNSRRGPSSAHNASPSPLLLNPINDEDWRAPPPRNTLLCLSLPLSTRSTERVILSLMTGYDVVFGQGRRRYPVRLSLLKDSTALFVSFYGGVDFSVCHKGDDQQHLYPFSIPVFMLRRVYSADSFNQDDHWFGIAYCDNAHNFERTLNFIAPTSDERDSIVAAVHALIISPTGASTPVGMTPILRQRKSPVQNYGSDQETLSPVSLSEDPASSQSTEAKSPESRAQLVYPFSSTSLHHHQNTATYVANPDAHDRPHRLSGPAATCTFQETNLHIKATDKSTCTDDSKDVTSDINAFAPENDDDANSVVDGSGTLTNVVNEDQLAGGQWCSDDICAAALIDLSMTFQGIFDSSGAISDPLTTATTPDSKASHRLKAEMYITDVLGSDFCDFEEPIISQFSSLAPAKFTNRVKNRIESLGGPKERWSGLCKDMTFASAEEEIQWKLAPVDDLQLNFTTSKPLNATAFTDASSFIGKLLGDMSIEDSLSKPASARQNDDTCYYDSDPESVRLRSKWKRKTHHRRQSHMRIPDRLCGVRMKEEDVLEVVDLMKTTLMTLLYHPTPSTENPCPQPTCVNAWIERGSYLGDQSYLQPKFMWKTAVERHLKTKKLNLAMEEPERVELLEIKRVHDSVESHLRRSYPLAIRDASFVVETRHRYYVFQARSVSEKRHIAFGLKLVVARLASLLMVRDDRAVEEWFEPVTVSDLPVPGGGEVQQDEESQGWDEDDKDDRYD